MSDRSRRRFLSATLALSGASLLAGCGLLPSQPSRSPTVRRIAHLSSSQLSITGEVRLSAFRQGLRDLGYVEGQNLAIDERHANGADQLAEPAAELVRLQTEVILVPSAAVALALREFTTTIPIVSAGAGNLVTTRLAASYARPGGNVTGLSTPSLSGKQLQLLQEAVPTLSRVAVLFDTTLSTFQREPYETAARTLGLQLQFVGAGGAQELEPAFDTAAREQADGLLASNGPLITAEHTRISELALQHRLPSMFQQTEAMARGGLMAYSPDQVDLYRRAATYVDKILKGAKPSELPVEQPTQFDFVINLKTARALGLTIPQPILQQATELIQ